MAPNSESNPKPTAEALADLPQLNGFRLDKFEFFNWGIFDGAVYSLLPNGQTTLLVGENGSGKSTLVDALLTLLVRPQTRNYNVAAGAGRNERDERTYIRGAHDRTIGEDGRPQVQYLRQGTHFYTVLLAGFRHAVTEEHFTLCQVLYLNADNSVERVYATCDGERSIVRDLAGLTSGSTLARQLKERGFEATASYNQYFHWLQRKTGLKSKAMDIFNQTVAVKDVQRLDLFIRQHMLEKQPWNERVSKLLTHFTELSEAHRMLVRVRQQSELLGPIVQYGMLYRTRSEELEETKRRLEAVPLHFADRMVELLSPICAKWKQQIEFHQTEMVRLEELLDRMRQSIARIEIEIEQAGGDRLRQLPQWIEQAVAMRNVKQEAKSRFEGLLAQCGIRTQITSPDQFHRVRAELCQRRDELVLERERLRTKSSDLQYEIGSLTRQMQVEKREVDALEKRKGNLPESITGLRDRLCSELKLPVSELPFVAELLEVLPEERRWESSIEQVLHGFARSMLVPNSHYPQVAGYVDATRLADERGHGLRLNYLRVSMGSVSITAGSDPKALVHKLRFRSHPFSAWVKAEILQRFSFVACETIEEFQSSTSAAMTIHRHIKKGNVRHEKDDRSQHGDRRFFVLGWDNQEKRLALRESIRNIEESLAGLLVRAETLDRSIDESTASLQSLEQASSFEQFDTIDSARHDFEASQLRLEKQKLEESNDVIQDLRHRADHLRAEAKGHQLDRDQHLSTKAKLESELRQGASLLDAATQRIDNAQAMGHWERLASQREWLAQQIVSQLTLENLGTYPTSTENEFRQRVDAMTGRMVPITKDVTSAMAKYLRAFPEEDVDLDPDIASLDSFHALYQRISSDDLPKHEERFKNRLNEKVLHEVGLLNSSLENDRQEIRDKIEQLNGALRMLEWKPGTYMKLEATDISDREIHDFRKDLAGCLIGTLDGTAEANEATFVRIEGLVAKLREPSNERWRDKVVDVRNWFNFAAREMVAATGESRSYYEGGTGQSGGEKGKLAFLVLVAAIAYQYDLEPDGPNSNRFHFVMVDEMFSRSDDAHAEYALDLFERFGLQLLIVAPLDAKVRVTEPYVGVYVHVVKDKSTHRSELITVTAEQLQESMRSEGPS